MTKRVTVSLPDDVAEYLEQEENASSAVADALRARMNRGAATAAMLRAAGFDLDEERLRQGRAKLPALDADAKDEIGRRR
jgi:Arc/MetJ-type ribon-helix-helix transcriptional regulator